MNIEELKQKSIVIRKHIIHMLTESGSGHPGGSLSAVELITSLYFNKLRHNPKDPNWADRDRMVFSKGHGCPLWYAILAECGYFPKEELLTLRKFGSMLQGHPDKLRTPGVDISSGSLGQAFSAACGMAAAGKLDKKDYRIYVLLGDGEIQEGQVWEAAMSASHYKLDNLCAILDHNRFQIDGRVEDVMNVEPLADKWNAFGWNVISIDGHDIKQVIDAYNTAETIKGKPTIIIAKTVKGKGVSFMEHTSDWHGKTPNKDESTKAIKEIHG
jgi:transketolase